VVLLVYLAILPGVTPLLKHCLVLLHVSWRDMCLEWWEGAMVMDGDVELPVS